MNSIELTDAVYERLDDVPSHTAVSMHRIVKEVIAVLVERGFIAYDVADAEETE